MPIPTDAADDADIAVQRQPRLRRDTTMAPPAVVTDVAVAVAERSSIGLDNSLLRSSMRCLCNRTL